MTDDEWEVIHGDCLDSMAAMDSECVDSVVCDPPYGLSFMGKQWDHGVPGVAFWAEALRVAKPGAHLVAFGGTRTFHRLTCAIEDAGWEIRDCLSWLYGSGFPKSHNGPWGGTALKPAWEPIILARKPLVGTVAANVAQHGTGGLNIDGCRVAGSPEPTRFDPSKHAHDGYRMSATGAECAARASTSGRWPANVALDSEAAAMLDAQSGELTTNKGTARTAHAVGGFGVSTPVGRVLSHGDSGGASRFFYCAKASRSERNAGLEGMAERVAPKQGGAPLGRESSIAGRGGNIRMSNHHPTVKPIALMRWLCRLVTPPGGLVLDPFTGSGTTGCAAVAEGFRFVGCEKEAEYVAIAEKRIAAAVPDPTLGLEATDG